MIKRFIVLTFFFVAGMTLGLAATSLLARSQRTPQAVPAHAPDEREPWPSHINAGSAGFPTRQPRQGASQSSDPIGIEASHGFGSIFPASAAFAGAQDTPGRGAQLDGAWNLNRDLSDDPRVSPAPPVGSTQGRRGGGFGGGFGGRRGSAGGSRGDFDPARMEAMQEVLQRFTQAAVKLTIVERDGEILVTDDEGRTQALKPDGRKVPQKMANGLVTITRKTGWNGATLVTEVEIENGPTVIQTYAPSEGGSQLVVTTQMNAPRGGQSREIKYVYDPSDLVLL